MFEKKKSFVSYLSYLCVFILLLTVSGLAITMGLAGPDNSILYLAWFSVPAPLILVFFLQIQNLPPVAKLLSLLYITISLIIVIILLLGVAWSGSETALHPEVCDGMEELSEFPHLEKNIEPITFNAEDGTKLDGWVAFGSSHKSVILLHGYRCDKRSMLREANMLYSSEITVLLFDFRHNGNSSGDFVSFGYYEKQDVAAAIHKLNTLAIQKNVQNYSSEHIGLFGVSNGGATAILFAAENPNQIKSLVVDSSFKSLDSAVSQSFTNFVGLPSFPFAPITVWITELKTGISRKQIIPEESVTQITETPIFIIHGLADETISPEDSKSIFSKANDPKQIWLVPKATHGETYNVATSEYEKRILDFFHDTLN